MKALGAAVLFVAGLVALTFWGMRPQVKTALPTVNEVPKSTVPAEVTYPCRIVPRESVWASTQVTGPLEAVLVDVGQMVTDGQVLARVKSGAAAPGLAAMEKNAADDHVRQVTVRFNATRAEAKRWQAEVLRTRAAMARAEPVFRKQELLNQAGATPRLVFENARAEYERAARELTAAEEASRVADNAAARAADELAAAQAMSKEKARAAVEAVAGMDTAEIHAPAAGLVVERRVQVGQAITEGNRAELFRIALHPELLRAVFDKSAELRAGQPVAIRSGGVEIRAVVGQGSGADFESRLGAVTAGGECVGVVRVN